MPHWQDPRLRGDDKFRVIAACAALACAACYALVDPRLAEARE